MVLDSNSTPCGVLAGCLGREQRILDHERFLVNQAYGRTRGNRVSVLKHPRRTPKGLPPNPEEFSYRVGASLLSRIGFDVNDDLARGGIAPSVGMQQLHAREADAAVRGDLDGVARRLHLEIPVPMVGRPLPATT